MMNSGPPQPAASKGFTLLEALIALVVISIGLLGLLGLQTVSVVNTQISEARTLASITADDIADRIRANPTGAADGDYDEIDHPAAENAAMPTPDCAVKSCSPAELAALDAWEWDRAIAGSEDVVGLLPNGHGYVDCTRESATGPGPCLGYTVTIGWDEREQRKTGTKNTASGGSNLSRCDSDLHPKIGNPCFITVVRP